MADVRPETLAVIAELNDLAEFWGTLARTSARKEGRDHAASSERILRSRIATILDGGNLVVDSERGQLTARALILANGQFSRRPW